MEVDIPDVDQPPVGDNNVTVEHLLRRLLYLGSCEPTVQLRGGTPRNMSSPQYDAGQPSVGGLNRKELDKLEPLLRPNPDPGMATLALQHVKAAKNNPSLSDKRALFLVLSAILKIDSKQVKTAAYKEIAEMLESPEDLFEFVYYHQKIFNKRPRGWGNGMRNLIKNWYLKQDPYDLALEVCRVRSRHNWGHTDLIKMSRVNSKDPGKAVVLCSLSRGTKKTVNVYTDNAEAQPVLEYLACVRELNMCTDPDRAAVLIENHSFDVECIPTTLQNSAKIWEKAVVRSPLTRVLSYLKFMATHNMISQPNSLVLAKIIGIFRDKMALVSSQLDPVDILGVLVQVEAGWELPKDGTVRHKPHHEKRVPAHKPHACIALELTNMMNVSFTCVNKMPLSMVICIDARTNITQTCFGAWNLKISRALSVLILSLLHAETNLTVIYCTEDYDSPTIKQINVTASDTVEDVTNKIEAVQQITAMNPAQMLQWVRRTKGKVDLVLAATHSHVQKVDRSELWAVMEQLRVENNNLKFVYWALHCKNIAQKICNVHNPNMLDVAGWSPDIKRILQAFAKDLF